MATIATPKPQAFRFNREVLFPGVQAALGIESPVASDAALAAALAGGAPFPDRDITFGALTLKADAGQDFAFGGADGRISCKGSGSAFAGLALFRDPADALRALPLEESLERGLQLAASDRERYLLFDWGYDAKAAVKGAIGLGYGAKATFGVDARTEGLLAVMRKIAVDAPALAALESAVTSMRLPIQVTTPDELPPGTWIIAEADGGIGLQLGAQFGYDFNWTRQTRLGGLKEDIGLRLQLAVNATVGLEASGKYAVVVSRPGEERILRLQLFKLAKQGLTFAFNAGAVAKADFSNLPAKIDDFIKAVFDVHGAQIIDDLHVIERWTDPKTKLSGPLSELGVDYARKLLGEITGIEDVEARFNEARGKVLGLLEQWDALPHRASTMVYKLVEENTSDQLEDVRTVVEAIAKGDRDTFRKLITDELRHVDFFTTPTGRFLESAGLNGVLALITSRDEFHAIQPLAASAAKLLSPEGLEPTLRGLQQSLETRLNLDRFLDPAKIPQFADIDQWLKLKLSQFLGRAIDSNEDIQRIREAISSLLAKRQEFYEKAVKALTRPYEARFAASCSASTTDTALIDAEFRFDANATDAASLLASALRGNFGGLLTTSSDAVRLNQGVLSHGISRTAHVELHLPKYDSETDHENTALAEVHAIEDNGRVLVYDLKAADIVAERNRRNSRLAVAAHLRAGKGTGIRIHSSEGITYAYAFRQAVPKMKSSHLRSQLRPYLETYFASLFRGESSINTWIADLDKQIDALDANGSEVFGNTLLSLELSLPGNIAAAWLDAPKDRKADAYKEMSRRIQRKMRELIPFFYLDEVSRYRDLDAVAPLLVYAALPAAASIRVAGGSAILDPTGAGASGLFWDYQDVAKRNAMVYHTETADRLVRSLQRAHEQLMDAGLASAAEFYAEGALRRCRETAITGAGEMRLRSLLSVEAEIVERAQAAGRAMAAFRDRGTKDPEQAVKTLAEFGSAITGAFHARLSGIYGSGALRPLGTMIFVEAAAAFLPDPQTATKPSALFELTVVKQQSPYALPSFLDAADPERPETADIVVQERLFV